MGERTKKLPAFEPGPLLVTLRALLLKMRPNLFEKDAEPLMAVAVQLSSRDGEPHPCPLDGPQCQPCTVARAMALLLEPVDQVAPVRAETNELVQPGVDLVRMTRAAMEVEDAMARLEPLLVSHVDRRTGFHRIMDSSPLREVVMHDHEALCVRPEQVLAAIRRTQAVLRGFAPAILSQFPNPELVTPKSGKPADTLFRNFVRTMIGGGFSKVELASVLDTTFGPMDREYWERRIRWAQRQMKAADRARSIQVASGPCDSEFSSLSMTGDAPPSQGIESE